MSRAINAIIDHYRATRGKRKSMMAFQLPGPDNTKTGGIEIFWDPWNLGEQDRVFGHFNVRMNGAALSLQPAAFARVVLIKGLDKDGKRLFADAEEIELLSEAAPDEMQRVAMAMLFDHLADNSAGAAGEGGEGPKQ
jgi:hypothetical protein